MAVRRREAYEALVSLPTQARNPWMELLRRGLLAVAIIAANSLIVWLDRDSYADNVNGDGVSFIDAVYYATVTVTTTGYGDITPVADHARLLNAILVTPLRMAFLVLLVGTTIEVLANQGRRALIDHRWRSRMRNHTVILGFGTMGRSALATLLRNGAEPDRIVVVDASQAAVEEANRDGVAAIVGDCTSRDLLRRAEVPKAKHIVITVNRDDTAILATLTARQLNPHAHLVVAVRSGENVSLLRQSGADGVVTSTDAVGRLVGLSAVSPDLGATVEDLLNYGDGLDIAQRQVAPDEVGRSTQEIAGERVLGVVRGGLLRRFFDPSVAVLKTGDELVVVRPSRTPRSRASRERQ
ncbi:MAG: NAD-binding protein [Propioniciclava sp.]|uniref:potassium channel family protein n=1 Tax=Propioniciclava sp. TaxID=2038686 RepID=UPI0039E34FC4